MRLGRWRLGFESNFSDPKCRTLDHYTTETDRIAYFLPLKMVSLLSSSCHFNKQVDLKTN